MTAIQKQFAIVLDLALPSHRPKPRHYAAGLGRAALRNLRQLSGMVAVANVVAWRAARLGFVRPNSSCTAPKPKNIARNDRRAARRGKTLLTVGQ